MFIILPLAILHTTLQSTIINNGKLNDLQDTAPLVDRLRVQIWNPHLDCESCNFEFGMENRRDVIEYIGLGAFSFFLMS